ncbi:SRP40 protein [Dictyocaulus viviparus]|uniref:SRP40 protein n=1 Tax=Dictyocaulus viviparus TaxID=29172 RepID=A0A0D8Y8W1_DICVI|nr:SRP40 protein [Dictyocaulus viviparus]
MSADLYAECILYTEIFKRNPRSIKDMFSAAKIADIKKFIADNGDIPPLRMCADSYLNTRKRRLSDNSNSAPPAKRRALRDDDPSNLLDNGVHNENLKETFVKRVAKHVITSANKAASSSSDSDSDDDTRKKRTTNSSAKDATPAETGKKNASSSSDSDSDDDEITKNTQVKPIAKTINLSANKTRSTHNATTKERSIKPVLKSNVVSSKKASSPSSDSDSDDKTRKKTTTSNLTKSGITTSKTAKKSASSSSDSDSDDEASTKHTPINSISKTNAPKNLSGFVNTATKKPIMKPVLENNKASAKDVTSSSSDSDSDDEGKKKTPTNNLAKSRITPAKKTTSSSDSDSDDETVKKPNMKRVPKSSMASAKKATSSSSDSDSEDETKKKTLTKKAAKGAITLAKKTAGSSSDSDSDDEATSNNTKAKPIAKATDSSAKTRENFVNETARKTPTNKAAKGGITSAKKTASSSSDSDSDDETTSNNTKAKPITKVTDSSAKKGISFVRKTTKEETGKPMSINNMAVAIDGTSSSSDSDSIGETEKKTPTSKTAKSGISSAKKMASSSSDSDSDDEAASNNAKATLIARATDSSAKKGKSFVNKTTKEETGKSMLINNMVAAKDATSSSSDSDSNGETKKITATGNLAKGRVPPGKQPASSSSDSDSDDEVTSNNTTAKSSAKATNSSAKKGKILANETTGDPASKTVAKNIATSMKETTSSSSDSDSDNEAANNETGRKVVAKSTNSSEKKAANSTNMSAKEPTVKKVAKNVATPAKKTSSSSSDSDSDGETISKNTPAKPITKSNSLERPAGLVKTTPQRTPMNNLAKSAIISAKKTTSSSSDSDSDDEAISKNTPAKPVTKSNFLERPAGLVKTTQDKKTTSSSSDSDSDCEAIIKNTPVKSIAQTNSMQKPVVKPVPKSIKDSAEKATSSSSDLDSEVETTNKTTINSAKKGVTPAVKSKKSANSAGDFDSDGEAMTEITPTKPFSKNSFLGKPALADNKLAKAVFFSCFLLEMILIMCYHSSICKTASSNPTPKSNKSSAQKSESSSSDSDSDDETKKQASTNLVEKTALPAKKVASCGNATAKDSTVKTVTKNLTTPAKKTTSSSNDSDSDGVTANKMTTRSITKSLKSNAKKDSGLAEEVCMKPLGKRVKTPKKASNPSSDADSDDETTKRKPAKAMKLDTPAEMKKANGNLEKQQCTPLKKKSNEPFRRVTITKDSLPNKFKDNSFDRSHDQWGAKAHDTLSKVQGKGFRHEKTKKKKVSLREVHIWFDLVYLKGLSNMGKRDYAEVETSSPLDKTLPIEGPTTAKDEYEHLCSLVNVIARPLAGRKLAKKLYKLVRKSSKQQHCLRQGLKDVQKSIRKDEKGIVVLAGNVSPIDVYSHIPALCEEKGIPYAFTPSREQLGLAAGHRRPAILLLIRPQAEYQELYDEVYEIVNALVVD